MVTAHDMGVVLITHNLGVVAQTCTHVAVMYAGTIVEKGPIKAVLADPAHPYTQALLRAIPDRSVKRGQLQGLAGAVPNLIHPPPGCRFAPRCALARESCLSGPPPVHTRASGHEVACPVVRRCSMLEIENVSRVSPPGRGCSARPPGFGPCMR
jgi:oligopeptide/dipeptide ABC transporter, ATP-binding protein, C-terminal domain